MKELLTEPVKGKHGTASYCSISGIDVSAKTGTTDNNYDRWLCGFTPYYTAATWYGYDKNETINFQGKKNPAGILWANIMSRVHLNKKDAKFEKPDGVTKITVCAKTGKSANTGCTDTYEEYYLPGTVPSICDVHTGNKVKDGTTTKPNNDSFDTTTKEDVDVITRPKTEEKTEEIKENPKNNENTTNKTPNENNKNDNNNDNKIETPKDNETNNDKTTENQPDSSNTNTDNSGDKEPPTKPDKPDSSDTDVDKNSKTEIDNNKTNNDIDN